jgi:hypothetical protein
MLSGCLTRHASAWYASPVIYVQCGTKKPKHNLWDTDRHARDSGLRRSLLLRGIYVYILRIDLFGRRRNSRYHSKALPCQRSHTNNQWMTEREAGRCQILAASGYGRNSISGSIAGRLCRIRLSRIRLCRIRWRCIRWSRIRFSRIRWSRIRWSRIRLSRIRLCGIRVRRIRWCRARVRRSRW